MSVIKHYARTLLKHVSISHLRFRLTHDKETMCLHNTNYCVAPSPFVTPILPSCTRPQQAERDEENVRLRAELAELQADNAELEGLVALGRAQEAALKEAVRDLERKAERQQKGVCHVGRALLMGGLLLVTFELEGLVALGRAQEAALKGGCEGSGAEGRAPAEGCV